MCGIENKVCIIYSSFTGTHKRIPLYYTLWGNRLKYILSFVGYLKPNKSYMQNLNDKNIVSKEYGISSIHNPFLERYLKILLHYYSWEKFPYNVFQW